MAYSYFIRLARTKIEKVWICYLTCIKTETLSILSSPIHMLTPSRWQTSWPGRTAAGGLPVRIRRISPASSVSRSRLASPARDDFSIVALHRLGELPLGSGKLPLYRGFCLFPETVTWRGAHAIHRHQAHNSK
jgi:hypothetical protein